MKVTKYSRQREAIKTYLASQVEHPTADIVYFKLREEFPNISLGTVYRNLNLLVDLGEAIKINSKDGSVRFDSRMSPHYHFVCEKCGSMSDLFIEPLLEINEKAEKTGQVKVNNHEVIFYGSCEKCKN